MSETADKARPCSRCGTALASDAPEGLCPRCLLALNLATQTETSGGEPGPHGTKVLKTPPTVDEIAKRFPQLEIIECLGRGGMGVVYKARQPRLDRLVALKILAPEKENDQRFASRFAHEAKALARLSHANIVTVHDFGEVDGLYYLMMEFVDGANLRTLLQARKIAPEEALVIVPKICEALQYAHDQGVVHRDIKPENVLLDQQGRVKIADFGIAKILGRDAKSALTEERQVVGTPNYMAPEQMEKPQTVDHRADIYSLGVVFYEMLTGELPLGKFAPPSQKVQVDVRLDEVVLRTLEKEPGRRYQHASEVKTDVETITTIATKAPSTSETAKSLSTQNRNRLGMGLAIVAAGVALAILVPVGIYFLAHEKGNASQLTQEGWQLWQARQMEQAAEKFNQAVKLAPNDAHAWNGLGWALFNSGKSPEAQKAFQKAISLDPNHPAALNGLGQVCLSQRNYADAESYLLKAAPTAPAAWYGLARLYLLQGKFEKAEEWARKVVASGQGDASAHKMLQAAREKTLGDELRLMIEPQ